MGDRDRPTGIADILGEKTPLSHELKTPHQATDDLHEEPVNTADRKTVKPESGEDKTETRNPDSLVNRKTGKTDARKTVKPEVTTPEMVEMSPKREEFKLPGQLAERLRVYVFDSRSKKTHVVIDALDEYLEKRGY